MHGLCVSKRAKQHEERRARLGYPDAKANLKIIIQAEERVRNGEAANVKPRVTTIAAEIPEEVERYQQTHKRSPWRWWK